MSQPPLPIRARAPISTPRPQTMSTHRPVNPYLKMTLEYGPILLFFVLYGRMKDATYTIMGSEYSGFLMVTAIFIPLVAAATFAMWRLSGHLSKMQLLTLVLVLVFGGAGLWFHDERFFKMKPTILYSFFAILLGLGLWRGESYLEAVMDGAIPLKREGWMILTRNLALFFAALAVLNEFVWRTYATDTWVTFKTFGLTAGTFAFFMAHYGVFIRYAEEPEHDVPVGAGGEAGGEAGGAPDQGHDQGHDKSA